MTPDAVPLEGPCSYCGFPSFAIRIVGVPKQQFQDVKIPFRFACGDCTIKVFDAILKPKVQVTA